MSDWTQDIHEGDAVKRLREMPKSSVHTVMCSPPYYGLRFYGDEVESVFGGDTECEHDWSTERMPVQGGENTEENPANTGADRQTQQSPLRGGEGVESDRCRKCGAWRGQLGLEPRLDQFVRNIVQVGEELRRVLRPDGSWWLNLGDSFAGSGRGQWSGEDDRQKEVYTPDVGDLPKREQTLRRKSKMLVPHRVAIALQNAGWVVRADAVWTKPNPMPHPVKDRLNEHKEFVFHLTPGPDYWFDLDAIREPHAEASLARRRRADTPRGGEETYGLPENTGIGDDDLHPSGKNPGDIFDISVKAFPEAHFAVYPPELCETPIKSSCPPRVCAACGTPHERTAEEKQLWERDPADVTRRQAKEALERYERSDLATAHLKAVRAVGFGDADHGDASQGSRDRVNEETRRLADEAKAVLGGYFREFVTSPTREPTGWMPACDCDAGHEPGIVLDPFAGAGTTCLVAKRLGRRFVGIDLNPEYVAMAQKRVGVDVDEPGRLLEDGETHLGAWASGGGSGD